MKPTLKAALLASGLLIMPGTALAQSEVSDQAAAVSETAEQLQQEANALSNVVANDAGEAERDTAAATTNGDREGDDGDSGKWGLLGLLGLAGLLGLKRRDRDHDRHDHRDHRGTATGTRTGTGADGRL